MISELNQNRALGPATQLSRPTSATLKRLSAVAASLVLLNSCSEYKSPQISATASSELSAQSTLASAKLTHERKLETTPVLKTIFQELNSWSQQAYQRQNQQTEGLHAKALNAEFDSLVKNLLLKINQAGFSISAVDQKSPQENYHSLREFLRTQGYYLNHSHRAQGNFFAHSIVVYACHAHPTNPKHDLSYINIPGVVAPNLSTAEVHVADFEVIKPDPSLGGTPGKANTICGTCYGDKHANVILLFPDGLKNAQSASRLSAEKIEDITIKNEAGNIYAELLLQGVQLNAYFQDAVFPDGSKHTVSINALKEAVSDLISTKYSIGGVLEQMRIRTIHRAATALERSNDPYDTIKVLMDMSLARIIPLYEGQISNWAIMSGIAKEGETANISSAQIIDLLKTIPGAEAQARASIVQTFEEFLPTYLNAARKKP